MEFHKLLQKQINKNLTPDCVENPLFKNFIKAVNDSYISFERDKELMNHAFKESEKEYYEVNNSLKQEYELKKQSIANLYESLKTLEDNNLEIQNDEKSDDLLYISKYLNKQIEKTIETEKNLSTTVELLKSLLANLQSGIKVEDENRNILYINQLYCSMFTIPVVPEDMIGQDCSLLTEEYKDLFILPDNFSERVNIIIKDRKLVTNELLETVDNRFLERDYIPIFIEGEYKGNLWKYTDVTERIVNQNLLIQVEEKNKLIMNSAFNAIITTNYTGKITFWNDQAEKIFGWGHEEVFKKALIEVIMPKEKQERYQQALIDFVENKRGDTLFNKQFEIEAVNRNRGTFPIEISIIPAYQNNKRFYCIFIQDISERKKAEFNLKKQKEKYQNIIANMNLGLIEVDNNEVIQYVNQSFSDISGFEIDELIGKKPPDLFIFGENFDKIENKKKLREKGVSDIYQIAVKNKRGELRWWAISGAPNYDDAGNLIGSIGIHLDITEQKQLEIELENEKIKAEEASKAKEIFLANMSHEIRTPLNAIIGFLRELEKQELTEIQKKYIDNSSIASKHLMSIINNILDISKIEAGEMAIDSQDFSIEKSINKVVSILMPRVESKDIKLRTTISPKVNNLLLGDALRIEQILFNLIGNSLKFTQKGKISIKCDLIYENNLYQSLKISIIDTGIGMDKTYLETLFNKFSQEDIAITRKFGGTGLGMAITKELINLMKGTINVVSAKNIGTKIEINLKFKKTKSNKKSIAPSTSETINIENISILLVEDNDLNRMVVQNTLSYYNCIVTEAENGIEALKLLEKQKFDIILMDVQMPEMDGIEATKNIRNALKLNTPIIALTANAFKTEIKKCKDAGMDDYISKPFDEAMLTEIIAKHTIKKEKPKVKKLKAKPVSTSLYNLAYLNSLSHGDHEFVKKMISIFMNQTNEVLEKINQALNENNFIEIGRLIHKIKASIQGMGVSSISNEIILLEKTANQSNDKEKITQLVSTISTTLQQVLSELKKNELK